MSLAPATNSSLRPSVRDRAPDSPSLDPVLSSATVEELSHPPAQPPASPLDSILLPHQYIVFIFPLTILAGSAIKKYYGETEWYFSKKHNILNVLFAKNGWGWTSIVFFVYLAVVFGRALVEQDEIAQQLRTEEDDLRTSHASDSSTTATAIGNSDPETVATRRTRTRTSNDVTFNPAGQNVLGTHVRSAASKTLPMRVIIQALVRWGLATAYWWIIVQWFFGPPIFDRIFVFSGGKCTTDDTFTGHIFTSHHCRQKGGKWEKGIDISGHMFLLTHSFLFLFEELSVFWNVPETWNVLARRPGARYAVYAVMAICALWWWMILMTSTYYHPPVELCLGLFFGALFWAATYVNLYKKLPFPSMPDQTVVL
ncbi:hypothetical protein BGW42_002388 [Actinomortierella wolfii]|nr:hypothetical protein BGW42_002388 [Actinomortierella wolfii]